MENMKKENSYLSTSNRVVSPQKMKGRKSKNWKFFTSPETIRLRKKEPVVPLKGFTKLSEGRLRGLKGVELV